MRRSQPLSTTFTVVRRSSRERQFGGCAKGRLHELHKMDDWDALPPRRCDALAPRPIQRRSRFGRQRWIGWLWPADFVAWRRPDGRGAIGDALESHGWRSCYTGEGM